MNKINNLIISASAGSGKTYRLTTRFLFLLLNGQDPTKTVALTFSKATAGEFLLSILRRLAGAAGHPALCKELADDFERDFDVSNSKLVTQENCALSLDRLVKQLHRLNLWTIDGFFNRVLSVFPFEFGLTGGYTIIDEPDQEGIRHQVLVRMLHGGSSKKMERLASSFKSANTGKASGRFFPDFSDFVKYNHPILLEVDNDSCWGDPMAVWGVSCPHQPMAEDERLHQLAVLREEAPGIGDKRIEKSLFVLAKKLEDWIPGQAFASVKCVEAAWRNLRDFKSGNGFCTYGEKSCAASADLEWPLGSCCTTFWPVIFGFDWIVHEAALNFSAPTRTFTARKFVITASLPLPISPCCSSLDARVPRFSPSTRMRMRDSGWIIAWMHSLTIGFLMNSRTPATCSGMRCETWQKRRPREMRTVAPFLQLATPSRRSMPGGGVTIPCSKNWRPPWD